ncbi:MAG: tetratricopeptide repeat protein [Chloroflexota bacterium]|nr:MAG: tetratricopeptide repeat protein [Chloroflexota bacterium]
MVWASPWREVRGQVRCETCGFDNPPQFRFCGGCGTRLVLFCPSCGSAASARMRFCGFCGGGLVAPTTAPVWPSAAQVGFPSANPNLPILSATPPYPPGAATPGYPPSPVGQIPTSPYPGQPVPPGSGWPPAQPYPYQPPTPYPAATASPGVQLPIAPSTATPPALEQPPTGIALEQVSEAAVAPPPPPAPASAATAAPSAPFQPATAESAEGAGAHGLPEQERRIVSVLFTDMSGSTAMAEKMDPEEFTTIVNDLFTRLGACITQYEGHIDKYIGDAIMATFGAPIAHENDPERAILAALDMQEEVRRVAARLHRRTGVMLRMRVGINTGEVIAGHVGSEARSDYTVMGDTVNTASRLEHNAPVGGILVSESTYRATRNLFDWRILEPITVKGKTEPLNVFEPTARATGGPRGVRGIDWMETPFIGRRDLVDHLVETYGQVCKGETRIFAAVGEAGLGKTRLRHEFQHALHRAGLREDALYLLGRCLPYAQGNSYGVVNSLLRDYFGLGEETDPVVIATKIRERGESDDAVETLLPLLTGGRARGALERLTPEQWQQLAFATVRDIVERQAGIQPVILFFEDMHWIDASSLDLLNSLIANIRNLPVFFFLIYRGELAEPPAWHAHPGFHREALLPFTSDESRALIGAILPGIEFPAGVLDHIVTRAAGNPFYIEEIIKTFNETGAIRRDGDIWVASNDVDHYQVPDTVQAIVRTRIDRLEDSTRRVLQQASVIGRTFSRQLLDEVSDVKPLDPPLDNLISTEFIRPADQPRAYVFRTALAQEVAYSVLLVRRRRAYHRRVADAYERMFRETIDQHVEDLARHYALAEIWPKALAFGRVAADRARAIYANAEAIQHYKRCLGAIDRLEELLTSEWEEHKQPDLADLNRDQLAAQRQEIMSRLADTQALIGAYDDAMATYTSGFELAVDPPARGDLLLRLAENVHEKRARWAEALDCLTRGREAVSGATDSATLEARIDIALSRVYWRLNRAEEARAIAETCAAALDGTDLCVERARVAMQLGRLSASTGDFAGAHGQWSRGLDIARGCEDSREIAPFLQNLGVASFRLGRRDEALEYFAQLNALCERTGDIWLQSTALGSLGGVARARQDLDGAVGYYERSARIKARIGDPRGVLIAYNNLAEVYGDQTEAARAIATYEKSLAIARDVGARDKIAYIFRNIASHRLELDDVDAAERDAREALAIASELGDKFESALANRVLAQVARRRGDRAEAVDLIHDVVTALREAKNTHELGTALLDLAELQHGLGRADSADAAIAEAAPLVEKAGSQRDKERLAVLRAPDSVSTPS